MLLVKDVMNKTPVTISYGATIREAISLFVSAKVSDLMVLDNHQQFKGVISVGDLIRYILPNYDDVILSTMRTREQAGELFFQSGREKIGEPFSALMISNAITLQAEEQLFSAAIIMAVKQIHILPVVNRMSLIGTLSRGELCQALLCDKDFKKDKG